jgi:hypothetical protein
MVLKKPKCEGEKIKNIAPNVLQICDGRDLEAEFFT